MIVTGKPAGESGKGVIHPEDAMRFIVDALAKNPQEFKNYGYDLYLIRAAERFATDVEGLQDHTGAQGRVYELSTVFFNVGWELCRRGILRPGVWRHGEQMTEEGSAGYGYSLTPYGKSWLASEDRHLFVPTEPERFAVLLEKYRARFGAGFHQRAQEALRCYDANAYLASCAMTGAAAESILLAAAIAVKDEVTVMKEYRSSSGRRKVENIILHGKDDLRAELLNQLSVLKYWRDDASHGTTSPISNEEAFVALAMLLRLAQFVEDNWSRITATPAVSTS